MQARKARIALTGLLVAIVLSGCATMSKEECVNADWRIIGFEDGASGSPANQIGVRRKACADHGVVPDKDAYDAGYAEGLVTYCVYDYGLAAGRNGRLANGVCPLDSAYRTGYEDGIVSFCTYEIGYEEAVQGRSYERVCPQGMEEDFLAGYEHGRVIHGLESRLKDIDSRLAQVARDRDRIDKKRRDLRNKVAFDGDLTGAERAEMLSELDALAAKTGELNAEEDQLKADSVLVRAELAREGYF
ncbi:MAG: DUF2799 domain-containing protein [Pseudomonadota bacterium]